MKAIIGNSNEKLKEIQQSYNEKRHIDRSNNDHGSRHKGHIRRYRSRVTNHNRNGGVRDSRGYWKAGRSHWRDYRDTRGRGRDYRDTRGRERT